MSLKVQPQEGPQLVTWLRAAGEPSRLRLLFLCSQRDFSVSDLATTLAQSEPRVSRHLRILSEAGLVERLRQGQWVHYRLSSEPAAAAFVQGLLGQLDRTDPQFGRDLQRAVSVGAANEPARSFESRLGRALTDFVAERATPATGCALVLGVQHLELLEGAAAIAGHCVAIARSRRVAQTARAFAERRGFSCQVLVSSGAEGPATRDIERALQRAAIQQFDLVIVDRLAGAGAEPAALLARARGALSAAGKLSLFEHYDTLDSARDKVVEHPLARLRRLFGDAGLSCERLSPIEADGQHVLAALGAAAMERLETTMRRA
jgi:DNA-binding transcriptional ArsR family regulator